MPTIARGGCARKGRAVRYRRDVVLKDGNACLLRSTEASDARECFGVFQVAHAETDYLLS